MSHIVEKRSTKESAERVADRIRKTLHMSKDKVIVKKYKDQYGVFFA